MEKFPSVIPVVFHLSSPQFVAGIHLAVPAPALTKVGEGVEQMDSRFPLSRGQASQEGRDEETRATTKSTEPTLYQTVSDRRGWPLSGKMAYPR